VAAAGANLLIRRLLPALVVGLLLLPAVATAQSDPLDEALVKTASAESYRFELDMKTAVPGLGRPVRFTGSGATDNQTRRTDMRLDLSKLARVAGAQLGKPADWQTRAIVDLKALVLYLDLPFLRKAIGSDKPWFRLDLTKAAQQAGIDINTLMQADPAQQLQYLRAIRGEARVVGQERVRGVDTTHYRATADLAKYPNALPAAQRARARASVRKLIQASGRATLPMDVWVDGDGYVRRTAVEYSLKTQGVRSTSQITVDLLDYGAPVDIEVPAADQTTDLQQAGKKGGS
jgi:hypothetical protein